jgi:myo-inositol-1(or 4)-monophosphatase
MRGNSPISLLPAADIVTQTDKAVESFIRNNLATHYPSFAFIGEETYHSGQSVTDEPTFIVDPIDGTSNFVHGFPDVAVSIALVVDKQPTVGIVYNPFRDDLWTAIKGQGAHYSHNTKESLPLTPPSPLQGLTPACIAIDFGTDRQGPNFALNLKVFTSLLRTTSTGGRFVNSLRCTGSAAIAICRVAAGQQDAFWECGSWAWDVAAAWCVLVEAGGVMVDGHPGVWNPPVDNRRYLAVRPATEGQKEFVEEFWEVIGDDRSTYGPP